MRSFMFFACLAVGCSSSTSRPHNATPDAGAGPLASEGFEGDVSAWAFRDNGSHDVGVVEGGAHSGTKSVRIAYKSGDSLGVTVRHLPVGELVGKHVTLSGWVKTEAVSEGNAALWIRVDGPKRGDMLVMDNMGVHGIAGTTPWTRYQVAVDVPRKGAEIAFGGFLAGNGTAWVDDLELVASEAAPASPVAIGGTVRDASGQPVGGATVAVVPEMAEHAAALTTTGADGRFAATVPPARYALTATNTGRAGGYRAPADYRTAVTDADVVLPGLSFPVHGSTRPPVGGVRVVAEGLSDKYGELYYTVTRADGTFELTLPPGPLYGVALEDRHATAATVGVHEGKEQTIVLATSPIAKAPDAVVAWMKQTAVPIASADPGHDLADLDGLHAIVGNARLVALGEATHGSREIFQLKHRIFQHLVAREGFTVFAFEANLPECRAVNDYVLHGTGDPRKAISGMYFWTWNTEEVFELVEWMRRWNAEPAHEKKVEFVGFDPQVGDFATTQVAAYLGRVGAEADARLPVAEIVWRFDSEKARWIAKTSKEDWATARQDAVVATQAAELKARSGTALSRRDEMMAANVRWLMEQRPPGTRMALWAHNGHVNLESTFGSVPMGEHLARDFGNDYLTFGFAFGRGAFQAKAPERIDEVRIGEAPEGDVSRAFHATGVPVFGLDLRHPPAGAAADWLAAAHPMREVGSVFTDEANMTYPVVLPRRFHAVLYVDETTRARPLPESAAGHN